MPRIPQYTAQLSRPNFNPVTADPRSAAMPYLAAAQVSESVGRVGDMAFAIAQKRKEQQDQTAAGDKYSEFNRELDEWIVRNQGREDLGEAFKTFADELTQTKAGEIDRPGASELFTKTARDKVDGRYGWALETGERNRYTNAQVAEQKFSQDAATAFRTYSQANPQGASDEVRKDLDMQRVRIDSMFGDVAPSAAAALKARAVEDVITGVIEGDPRVALEMIDEYEMDEDKRRELRTQANQRIQTRNALAIQEFGQGIEDSIADGLRRMEVQLQPSLNDYVAVYGDAETAKLQYNRDKQKYDVLSGTVSASNVIRGKTPAEINRHLAAFKEKDSGEVGSLIYNNILNYRDQLIKLHDSDPASYVRQFNPSIQEKLSQRVGGNAEAIDLEVSKLTLKYQGEAPRDANGNWPIDAAYYMNLPAHHKSVLPAGEAERYADIINNASPSEQLAKLREFDARFGGDASVRDIAWRDLSRLPAGKRVREGVQMAMLHIDSPIARSILASQTAYSENLKTKNIKEADLKEKLASNSTWNRFAAAFGGDTPAAGDFGSAILAFAAHMDGSADKNVDRAVRELIETKFAFEPVGGQTLPFAMFHPSIKQPYSKDEMEQIAASVRSRFNNLDFSNVRTHTPDNINLFPFAPWGAGDENMSAYLNANIEKMLVPAEDGGGFYVYMNNQSKIPVQLFTKDGRPMFIDYYLNDKRNNSPQRAANPRIIDLQGYTNPPVNSIPAIEIR